MKLGIKLLILILFLALFLYLSKISVPKSPPNTISSATPVSTSSAKTLGAVSHCQLRGVLPDASCTPGATNPQVTQQNLFQTICSRGYTKTVRPPVSYTNNLKIKQIAEYGYIDTNPHNYEEDHLISLELGGSPTDPKNLWPEPGASPNPKDSIENLCHKKVCSGQISLSDAQRQIAQNWQTACQ